MLERGWLVRSLREPDPRALRRVHESVLVNFAAPQEVWERVQAACPDLLA